MEEINIKKVCKECNIKTNLETHHEIYPIERKDIIKAIKDGKIYFLCKDCHIKEERKKNAKR